MNSTTTTLKRGILIFTSCVIILPMTIVGIAFIAYHKQTTLTDISNENLRLARAVSNTVSSFLEAPLHTLNAAARQTASSTKDSPSATAYLENLVTSFGFFESIMVLDSRDIVRNIGVGKGVALNREMYIGTNLSAMDTVRQAHTSGHHAWSNTFISPLTGEPTLSLALPFSDGIIIGNINLKDLSRIVSSSPSGNEYTYLVNRTGRIIACPDRKRVERQESVSTLPGIAAGMTGKSGAFRYISNGTAVLGAVSPIVETGWLVVVERPERDVFANLKNIEQGLAGAILVSLVLVMTLVVYISRRIITPVTTISTASRNLANGIYPQQLTYAGGFRELAQLADNFNAMSQALQEREQTLQEQNEELTAVQAELLHQLTETRHAQEELSLREESFRTVADWTYDWEYWISPGARIVYMTPSCERVTGYTPTEFMADAHLLTRIVHPEDQHIYRQHLDETLPHQHAGNSELSTVSFRIIHRDESIHWIDHLCRPVFSSNGDYLGRRVCNRDTTEQRLLEQQIIQQQKLESVGLLAGGIAHDFNNLLAPIFIYSEMIRNKLAEDDPSYSKLSTILEAAGKAKELVRQLLTFSSKQQLTTQRHDLNLLTANFVEMLRRTIRENIELKLQLCQDSCPVMADQTQLEQIMLNLAVNAQDAISGNGCITVETGHLVLDNEYCAVHLGAKPGRYVMLAFQDTGCGMDDATLNHVFEPFFTTKPAGHGTGLGLATVYGIVKQHGGHIAIQSKQGTGTTFQIFLPECMTEKTAPVENDAESSYNRNNQGTVLLVEDNIMVREMTADLLTSQNFKVIVAGDPEEALTLFHDHCHEITLLLSDIVMPGMSGTELAEQLILLNPELKVLFMSGYANNFTIHKGALDDSVNFIAKPFTSETLLRKINELVTTPGETHG